VATQEIKREEWGTFFDTFSRKHEGWVASLEVLSPELGAQGETNEMPLEGISIASGNEGPTAIAISFAGDPDNHIEHLITQPEHVWIDETRGESMAALEIESKDEIKTVLTFRTAQED